MSSVWPFDGTRYLAASALIASTLVAASGSGQAQDASLAPCAVLAGTYLTTVTDIEDVFASRGLITFTADGSFLVNDSGQGGTPGVFQPFSLGQGAWKCNGKQADKVKAEAVSLTFVLPSADQPQSFGRVDYRAELDLKTQEIAGSIKLSFTREGDLEGADPVNTPGPLFEEFEFVGKRVIVK